MKVLEPAVPGNHIVSSVFSWAFEPEVCNNTDTYKTHCPQMHWNKTKQMH